MNYPLLPPGIPLSSFMCNHFTNCFLVPVNSFRIGVELRHPIDGIAWLSPQGLCFPLGSEFLVSISPKAALQNSACPLTCFPLPEVVRSLVRL